MQTPDASVEAKPGASPGDTTQTAAGGGSQCAAPGSGRGGTGCIGGEAGSDATAGSSTPGGNVAATVEARPAQGAIAGRRAGRCKHGARGRQWSGNDSDTGAGAPSNILGQGMGSANPDLERPDARLLR